MSPTLIVGALLVWVSSVGFSVWYGMDLGQDKEFAKRAREDEIVKKVSDAAQIAAATAIAANRPKNVTNVQEVRREIQEKVVYRECVNTPGVLLGINAALTGERPNAAGGLKLPSPGSAKR